MPLSYHLARLSIWDIRAVYHLEQAIFPQDAYPYLDLALLLMTPNMVNLKAEGEAFLGFIAVADVWFSWRPAWIMTLGVAEAYQNQGVGKALLSAIEPQLKAKSIRLTVRRGNDPARHLYETQGYQEVYTAPFYYADGEDGVVMEKHLR